MAITFTPDGYEVDPAPAIGHEYALAETLAMMELLGELERTSGGALRRVESVGEIRACMAAGVIVAVLHLEGAEAIAPDLSNLEELHTRGLRSLGIVWSRPNCFGHGVPFRFPASPDTGPGLTDAGRDLVRECNRLGIVVDLAHLNERGFWDVTGLSNAPLVVSHSAAHAITPTSRNMTDEQLRAIADSDGVIGITFHVGDLRPDGDRNVDTPLEALTRHFRHVADLVGVRHVVMGSDFDGCTIPRAVGDVAGLPLVVEALHQAGFSDAELELICVENWLRVLGATWR